MLKSCAFIILLAVSVARSQFYYNYEEDSPDAESYPPAENQQDVQPIRRNSETPDQQRYTRTRVRVRSRNYPSGQDYPSGQPQAEPEVDRRALRQERRQARQRQREEYFVQPPSPHQPPKVYGPSVFENIRLGEAPSGVYVPHDSLLNVLKSPSQTNNAQPQVQQPPAVQPQLAYVQEQRSGFFVTPPSNEDTRPSNLILPISRPPTAYPVAAPAPPPRQTVQAHAVRTNRQSRQRVRVQPQPAPPTVDIDSYRESVDDVDRENIQITPQVVYASGNTRQAARPQSRRRTVTRYQETTPAPRVYGPSVFEKVGLGEAPSGVYVPEDSLLNILRNPSVGHAASQVSRREIQQVPARQPTQYEADIQNDYIPDVVEEPQYQPPLSPPPRSQSRRRSSQSQYQAPPPPPPPSPSPSRRRSSQSSRQTRPPSRTETYNYQNEYEDQIAAQPIQPSSHSRYQGGNEDYEDFSRLQPPVRTQVRPQRRQEIVAQPVHTSSHIRYQDETDDFEYFARQKPSARSQVRPQRPQEAAAPRRQPQVPAPAREEPAPPRKAKLAIAALPPDTDGDEIPGEAGVDYPVFHVIPKTAFSCGQQSYNGYYADMDTSCQVVHLCQAGGVQSSFLCPNGTIFNQEKFSCQWWYKVNCSDSPRFYIKNDELYKVPEKPAKEAKKRN